MTAISIPSSRPLEERKIDLIPFGGVSEDGRTITWHGNQAKWGILGFEDSYRSAAVLPLDGGARFRLATLPAIVTLKIMSFYERLAERKHKDGADIGFTLAHYVGVGDNRNRLARGSDAAIMERVGGDLQRAGAALLGRDMAAFVGEETRKEIVARLACRLSRIVGSENTMEPKVEV